MPAVHIGGPRWAMLMAGLLAVALYSPEVSAQQAAACPTDSRPRFEFQLDHPATLVAGARLPAAGRRYIAQFIVDTLGRPDSGTFRLLDRTRPERLPNGAQRLPAVTDSTSVATVWTVVGALRYTPAELQGCKVRQLVQVPVSTNARAER